VSSFPLSRGEKTPSGGFSEISEAAGSLEFLRKKEMVKIKEKETLR
jgi:hypothetical protein